MDQAVSNLEMPKVSWAPVIQVLILCVGTLVSFLVAYANQSVSIYLPFISETGAKVPEMCIFSFTLILGSFAGIIVVFFRYLVMRHLLVNRHERLRKLNIISSTIGFVSMLGLAGVAAFPMSTVLWVHLLAAGVHFFFALVYILLQTFIHYYVPGSNVMMRNFRMFLCLLLLLFLLLFAICFPLSFFQWKNTNSHPPAIKTPDDKVFGIMFSSTFFEWALYGTFLAFMFTYFFEFRNFQLTINVIPISPKTDQGS